MLFSFTYTSMVVWLGHVMCLFIYDLRRHDNLVYDLLFILV